MEGDSFPDSHHYGLCSGHNRLGGFSLHVDVNPVVVSQVNQEAAK